MAKNFTRKDVYSWKVCDRMGKTLRDADGDLLNNLNGYSFAARIAAKMGAVAVRV